MSFTPRVVAAFFCVAPVLFLPRPCLADDPWRPSAAGHMADLFPTTPLTTLDDVATAPTALLHDSQEQAAKPPEPAHTGFGALARSTVSDFVAFPKRKSTWVILAIGLASAGIAHPVDNKVNRQIEGSTTAGRFLAPGKYIGSWYVQTGASVGIWAVGRYFLPNEGESRTNKMSHLGLDLIRGQIVSQAIVQGMKQAVRRDRPTGKCCAFPSGHAASAFAAAAIIERHLGYRFAALPFFGALYVATSRLHDHVHYLSDVLMGAAVGTAAGWTVVGRHGRETFTLAPVPVRGGMMLAFTKVEPETRGGL